MIKIILNRLSQKIKKKAFTLLACFFLFLPFYASAQDVSPGEQPAAQGSRFKSESEQNKKSSEKKKAKVPVIELEKEKETPVPGQGVSFVLKNVRITGSTIFSPDELSFAYKNYIGRQVVFNDIERIASVVKSRYKKKGYLTSDVYIPEQDVARGEVEIRVSEGKTGEIKLEGNKWFSRPLLEKYIHSKRNELLNIFTLQKDLLRLNQNPDLELAAVLSAGEEPATTDIILKVRDNFPYHAGYSYDNQGTRLVGKSRNSLVFRGTNFSGHNDFLIVNTLKSETSLGEFFSYTLPLGTNGARLGFDFTNFYLRLGSEYKDADITGTTQIFTPHVSSELFLSPDFQAYADLGVDIKSIKKKSGGDTVTNDQIRSFYGALDFAKIDSFLGGGQTIYSPRFSFFTKDWLGASSRDHPSASRSGAGGFFFKYEQALSRIQRAPGDSFISVRSQFLAASRTLPSSEQLQLGGAHSVRGYPEGEYLADIGAFLNVEWVFPGYFFPKGYKLPRANLPLRDQFQPVIFFDLGEGKLKKTGEGERHTMTLMGAGAGIRFQFNKNLFLRLDWAKRLGQKPSSGQGPSNFYITCQLEI
ncbi:MAG: POTRA domain-containing protein [Candidatus Omnitrophota bacterium]